MVRVTISVLGDFLVLVEGRPAPPFESDKARALLAYLAVEFARPQRREALAGLLWPERPNSIALSNLRHALFNVRQVIGDNTAPIPLLLTTHDTVGLNPAGDYWLDARAFGELLAAHVSGAPAAARLEEAVRLYRGAFLEDLARVDSAPFEEWLEVRREQFHRQASEALSRLTALYADLGQHEPALKHARSLLELDPWREEAHQQIMRLLAATGQRSAALAQYETCRRVLAEELGAEPAPETIALVERIRRGVTEARPAPIALPAAPAFLAEDAGRREAEPPVFVAREVELGRLEHFLTLALQGHGRVAFVTGGPGRGKTLLMRQFARQAMQRRDDLLVAFGAGNAYTGVGDPYHPFLEMLQMLVGDVEARWIGGAITREHAIRLWRALPMATEALLEEGPDLFGRFVNGPALLRRAQASAPAGADWVSRLEGVVERMAGRSPAAVGQADLSEQVVRVLLAAARRQPLLLALDDLQWFDQGSVNLLFHLGRRLEGSRILVLGAYRPADVASGREGQPHPLEPVIQELGRAFGEIEVNLSQAEGRHFVAALLDRQPNRLGAEFREALYHHTGGHALFTVELLRGLQERGGLVRDASGQWAEAPALDWEALPARVEAAIAERLGRLGAVYRRTLAAACVQGEEFTAEVVAAVLGEGEGETIHRLSQELSRRQRLVAAQSVGRVEDRRLSRYRFRHYLYQRYLYTRLDAVERAHLHEATGRALEALYGKHAGELAVALARHFEEAGAAEKAVHYLLQAGRRAQRLSAHGEAITHLERGLKSLEGVPQGAERRRLEFDLQASLGISRLITEAYNSPAAARALARARELSAVLGNPPETFQVLCGQLLLYRNQGHFELARREAELLLSQIQAGGNAEQIMVCQSMAGTLAYWMGDYDDARGHLEQAVARYDPAQLRELENRYGMDHGRYALNYLSNVCWTQGYLDRALAHLATVCTLVEQLAQTTDDPRVHMALKKERVAWVFCFGRWSEAESEAALYLQLARQAHDILEERLATFAHAEALAHLGRSEEALAEMKQAGLLFQTRTGGGGVHSALSGFRLAKLCLLAGRRQEGLQSIEASQSVPLIPGALSWQHRVHGELLLLPPADESGAEACFQKALDVARSRKAKMYELLAAMSLARLWRRQGRAGAARELLAGIYGWFTEGFDTPDSREAKALLDDLAQAAGPHRA